jgi:hypothetical protein
MSRKHAWMLAAWLIALVPGYTCHKIGVHAGLDEAVRLHKGEWASFAHRRPLEIAFLRVVEDSRCPKNVACIRAGDAVVQFAAKSSEGGFETIMAKLPEAAQVDSIPWSRWSSYKLRVLRLEPYPVGGVTSDSTAYVVTFVVKEA